MLRCVMSDQRLMHCTVSRYIILFLSVFVRPGPHWGSLQHPQTPYLAGKGLAAPPKNPTSPLALRASGCGPSGLANALPNYPTTFPILRQ